MVGRCWSCGNPLGLTSTSCPKCGTTFIGRTLLILAAFVVIVAVLAGVINTLKD
jgi:hypothetical protein